MASVIANEDTELAPVCLKEILTGRQYQVTELLAKGFKNAEIGKRCGTTEHVIKNYLRVIYDETGKWNRVELALLFVHHQHFCPCQQSREALRNADMDGLDDQRRDLQPVPGSDGGRL